MKSSPSAKVASFIILTMCITAVVLAACFFLIPFESIKPVIDSLVSDGDFESFTLKAFHTLQTIFLVIGFAAAVIVCLFIFFRKRFYLTIQGVLDWIKGIKSLQTDSKAFFNDFKNSIPEKSDRIILLFLIILGAALRAILSSMPMGHDESYTYIVFAVRDLGDIIRDYHLPNNHVFHTVLVHFSTQLFGTQPWAIRLPAVLSILSLIPASYLVGRYYFNRKAALLISAVVAMMPNFILTSLNARGYPVVALIVFTIWALAIYLKKNNNLIAWILFILFSTLGFFTLPMMLYPFGMVIGWLFVSWLFSDISPKYPRWVFLRSLILSGVVIVVLTMLLYTPIFLNNGFGAIFSNSVIQGMKVENLNLLSEDLYVRLSRALTEWHTGFGVWGSYVSLFGVGWAWLRFKKISRHAVSALGLGLLWILALLVLQMVVGWARIWFFLSPIYFMYALAGWGDIFDLLRKKMPKKRFAWAAPGLLALIIVVGSAVWWFRDSRYDKLLQGSKPYTQLAAEFIAESGEETDLIVVKSPDGPIIWYYGANLGIAQKRYNIKSEIEFTHAFLLVNTASGQTIQDLLDSKRLNVPSYEDIILVYQAKPLDIYYTPITNLAP